MNILIPLAGNNAFGENNIKPLVQVNQKTVIEHVIENIPAGPNDQFIFVLNQADCDRFYLDSVLKLIKPNAHIIRIKGKTQGQLCSCLLGIEHFDNDEPLLIVNGDQYLASNVKEILDGFARDGVDGGIVTFNSIHPKWSYALLDADGKTVLETSEKRPISNNATVGIYYYRRGSDFARAAKTVILKDTRVNDYFFVSSTFNELLLANKRVIAHQVRNDDFFGLDSEDAIRFFTSKMGGYQ